MTAGAGKGDDVKPSKLPGVGRSFLRRLRARRAAGPGSARHTSAPPVRSGPEPTPTAGMPSTAPPRAVPERGIVPTTGAIPRQSLTAPTARTAASPTVRDPAEAGHPEDSRDATWRRLRRMGKPRMSRSNVLATALTLSLGFAIATQIQQTQETGLASLRQDELVRVLDDVNQRSSRLDQQVRELEAQRDVLTSGANTAAEAAAQSQKRLDQLSILAGTAPARGPGIALTISDPGGAVRGPVLLDVLQELRDAGAEVVQVGAVRVVAGSFFTDAGSSVTLDGQPLTRPYVFMAIGDPKTMASAMQIPGGIVDTARRLGANAVVEERRIVEITALHTPKTPRYAQPVPEAGSPGGSS
jgi:uncharacterized protein YlxW (UPF0749 family)